MGQFIRFITQILDTVTANAVERVILLILKEYEQDAGIVCIQDNSGTINIAV